MSLLPNMHAHTSSQQRVAELCLYVQASVPESQSLWLIAARSGTLALRAHGRTSHLSLFSASYKGVIHNFSSSYKVAMGYSLALL